MDRETMRKQAIEKEMEKRYPEAAALYAQMGLYEKAAFLYQKAGILKDAFENYMRAEKPDKAAEICMNAGYPDKAAELFLKAGDPFRAGKVLVQAKRFDKAAELYEQAGQWQEAARMYLLVRNLPKAGEMYEKAGDTARAADVYEQMIANKEDLEKLQGGDAERIVKLLEKVQKFERAAEVYLHTKEVSEAILMYIRMGDYASAARVYATCRGDIGYEVVAAGKKEPELLQGVGFMFEAAKDYHMAGQVFEMLKDYVRAGRNYDLAGDPLMAAESFFKAEDMENAAEMYERAGVPDNAAGLFDRIGQKERAALNFERAGRLYDAGRRFYELERFDKAIEVLQRLPDSDDHFLEATMIVGEILKAKGFVDLAIDKYRKVLASAPVDQFTVEFRYRLARILMERGDWAEAEKTLKEVAGVDLHYKDTQALLAEVARSLAAPPAAELPAAMPAPVASLPEIAAEPEVPAPAPAAAAAAAPAVPAAGLVQRMDGFQFLQETPLFEDLTLSEMKRFYEICETVAYHAGQVVIQEGQPGQAFFIVRSGVMKVTRQPNGHEEILALLNEGEHFGEMGLIDDQPTSATVAAVEEAVAFRIPRERFEGLMNAQEKTAAKMYRVLLRTLSQRLRRVNAELTMARH